MKHHEMRVVWCFGTREWAHVSFGSRQEGLDRTLKSVEDGRKARLVRQDRECHCVPSRGPPSSPTMLARRPRLTHVEARGKDGMGRGKARSCRRHASPPTPLLALKAEARPDGAHAAQSSRVPGSSDESEREREKEIEREGRRSPASPCWCDAWHRGVEVKKKQITTCVRRIFGPSQAHRPVWTLSPGGPCVPPPTPVPIPFPRPLKT